jgi:membrane protein DedA with SNARE-associated domain
VAFELPSPAELGTLSPLTAFLVIVGATWLAEDPALVLSATAWVHGSLSFDFVLVANLVGIASGDLLLYALGRRYGEHLPRLPWIGRFFSPDAVQKGERFFRRQGLNLVMLARFVPGLRLPTYTAAGIFKAPLRPVAGLIVLSGLVWVPLQMALVRGLSRDLRPVPGFFAALGVFLALAWMAQGFVDYGWERRGLALRRLGRWEFWPPWLFYLGVAPAYLRLWLRHGHPLLPSLANPGLEAGGLIGESKDAILERLPAGHPARLKHRLFEPGSSAAEVRAWMEAEGLSLPVILKPDLGQRGSGVRLCRDEAALADALAGTRYRMLAQEYCPWEREAGIYYARAPWGGEGQLLSFTDKRFPTVVGDGKRSLARLILDDPRARWACETYFHRWQARLDDILAPGERLRLVESGNHAQGALFLDGRALMNPSLLEALDGLARSIPGFHAGRFDLRYEDEAGLREGRFKVIEINGAGAEMTHIWDPGYRLADAWRDLAGQWALLFAFGAWQREHKGLKPMPPADFLRRARGYRRLARLHLDAS